jgi:hypothetical protein
MSILNFEQPEKSKSRSSKPSKFMVAIGIALILFGLRSTLASSINLNSGGPIEFGQGKIITSACDSEILMSPNSTFINAVGGGEYRFTSLTFSDINSDSSHCSNKSFTIKAYGNGGANSLNFVDSTSEIIVEDTGSNFVLTPATGVSISQDSGDVSTFTLLFNSANSPMLTDDLDQITIESKDSLEITYALNDEGPAGGWIVYHSVAGFPCGLTLGDTCHYLEAAKADWNLGTNAFPWAITAYKDVYVGGGTSARDATKNCDAIVCGLKNTQAIVDQGNDATTAAGIARAYNGGGNTDWFLPSINELHQVVAVLYGGSGDLANSFTWSSSEKPTSPVRGRYQYPSVGSNHVWFDGQNTKNGVHEVRPVRAF